MPFLGYLFSRRVQSAYAFDLSSAITGRPLFGVRIYQTRSPETRRSRPDMRSYSVRGNPSQLLPHRGGSCEADLAPTEEEEEEEEEEED